MHDRSQFVDALFDESSTRFTRLRHPREPSGEPAARASFEAARYVRAFWPYVGEAIAADPERLGLRFARPDGSVVAADALSEAFLARAPSSDPVQRRLAAQLSSQAVMSGLLDAATARWVGDFDGAAPRCPLAFDVAAADYVSLRMLLGRRGEGDTRPAPTAPVLVMGGTATALAMCWNLLGQAPRAFTALSGREPERDDIERIWHDTRELVFRIGAGPLAAFVAFASACSSTSGAMLWDGAGDLGLAERDGRYAWTMNAALAARYRTMFDRVAADQQGAFVGCTALYTRAPPLPLAPAWAEPAPAGREPSVFGELLRWMSAVARRQYFACFDPPT